MAEPLQLTDLLARLEQNAHDFAEVFRAPSGTLSLSVARWPAGSVDDQQPHTEDEVYYVAAGRAVLDVAGDLIPVRPGSIAFVAAGVEHRFTLISEDLETLVLWSPAHHASAGG
jgi:mannose-6-phosphate isomerase-like protein (cupin superfamily)